MAALHPPMCSLSVTARQCPSQRSCNSIGGRMLIPQSAYMGHKLNNLKLQTMRHGPRQRRSITTMGLFGLGFPELAVIAGVAVLIFGPTKLPELGKELGKTVKSFQNAAKEFETELKKESEGDGALKKEEKLGEAKDRKEVN
eukprot:jgi/Botrbrau1/16297/Bobra.0066s0066.1